jgi:hypothetical protein
MSKFLFEVQQKNRLEQKGLLRRFSITCYGHQDSIEELRAEKAEKFKELKSKKGTTEYDEWFLSYRPEDKSENKTEENIITKKTTPANEKKKKTVKSSKKKKYVLNFWGKNKTSKNKKRIY